ncbi:hypothetical protein M3Y97_00745400 [Aphelenchoides bicaudatus]|nr:hypothetical protein M3Y97_00745400 [Aphelenchoides bicaudatus]
MQKVDVLCEKGIITEVGTNLSLPPDTRVIDATDRGIDPHTHMQLPFMGQVAVDDFYVGTRAALAGGTTMIIDFVIPTKQQLPLEAYHQWRSWADPKVCCDYALSMAITTWSDEVAQQMEQLTQPEFGINSFKFFLAYKDVFMVQDDEFFQGLKQCAKIGALARVHAENGSVIFEKQKELLESGITGPEGHTQSRPEELEAEATNRACILASEANCPLYVVHVMSKLAANVIAQHRQNGTVVFGEPIAAGLACTGDVYYDADWTKAAFHVLSPPLSRDPNTPGALMDLLACGQLHTTGTDNCSFTCEQKLMGLNDFTKIPNGVNGVEDRLSIIWEKGVHAGKLDPMRFVAITRQGRIAVGADADIVIWNPNAEKVISSKTHHHATNYNIFEGLKVHGIAETTICNGKVVWENNELNVEAGFGNYVPAKPFCEHVFGSVAARQQKVDVLCEDGIITEVGTDLQAPPNAQIIDATDRCVIPGGIDPHTHFELRHLLNKLELLKYCFRFRGQVSKDDFFIGTKAALAGGTTTIIDFAIPTKQQLPVEAYHQWRSWADPKVCCDYMLTVAITSWNQEVAKQMELLTQPEYGINNFKFYLAYNELMVNDAEFYNGLKQCSNIGALARVHCENGPIIAENQKELLENEITGPEGHILCRPEQLEAEAVNRACVLASEANCPLYVVHVMSKKAADVVVRHVEEGKIIFGEALGAGLACTGEAYFSKDWQHAATHVMSPPLSKDPDTPNYLIDLLARDKLNTTGSDNATWCCEQKRQGLYDFSKILSGLNGVEDRLSIVSTAAKIFNVYPKKGRIAIGSDADIVIWNPNAEKTISAKTHHQAVDTNVFEGMVVHGVAEVTVCNGRVVWENNKLNVEAGSGRFIHAKPFCKHVFERIDSKRNKSIAVQRDM